VRWPKGLHKNSGLPQAADELLVRSRNVPPGWVGEFFKPLMLGVEGGNDARAMVSSAFKFLFRLAAVPAYVQVELDLLQPLPRGHQESLDVRHKCFEFL